MSKKDDDLSSKKEHIAKKKPILDEAVKKIHRLLEGATVKTRTHALEKYRVYVPKKARVVSDKKEHIVMPKTEINSKIKIKYVAKRRMMDKVQSKSTGQYYQ